ncbi:anti-virulence regulator CigR family protein [Pelagibius sp. 7325]|uniref:anti-virulence regulator CigR family protein n=1 Tax=Pelagibius sp. 7325 TaxID=3131994 RepID=UPI0030ED902F
MLRLLAAILALSLVAATPALADNGKAKGKGNNNPGKPNDGITSQEVIEGVTAGVLGAVLSDDERRIIHRYFGEHPDSLGKVKELPPGIRKKLARGGAMPPGIAKQALPDGLHRQLPPRNGQHYEIIGTDVVLVETATRIIVDVLKDVLRRS